MERAESDIAAPCFLEWNAFADQLNDVDALFYEIEITRHHYNGSGRTLRALATSAVSEARP
jgi:hypothetical protein